MMVSRRLTGLLLVCVVLQMGYSTAHNYQGVEASTLRLGGRKMLHRVVLVKEKLVIVKDERLIYGKISGANPPPHEKCNQKENGKVNGSCKRITASSGHDTSNSHPPKANGMPSQVAASADYHDPTSHPSRHN